MTLRRACAQRDEAALLDLGTTPPRVFAFGVKAADNEFHWASWGKRRSVIALKRNVRFIYAGGRLTPPPADNDLWSNIKPTMLETPVEKLVPYARECPRAREQRHPLSARREAARPSRAAAQPPRKHPMSTPDNPLQLPAHIKAMPDEEKRLRKEWLKRKFASFEYHEEMLRLHHQWVEVIRKALKRALQDPTPDPDYGTKAAFAKNFEKTDWPLILANDDLGKYSEAEWDRYRHTATFRSIPDYSRYLVSEGDRLAWMTEDEQTELTKYWTPMARMAQNIAYTVDERWEEDPDDADWILDEEYTGPIGWPDNWRTEVSPPRIKAGEPAPQGGVWQSVDDHKRQLRVHAGERLPDLGSAYGITLWERIGD